MNPAHEDEGHVTLYTHADPDGREGLPEAGPGRFGYICEEGHVEIRGYGGNRTRVDLSVATKNPGYDIGFRKVGDAYEIVADWWGIHETNQERFLQQVLQRYAYHVARVKLEAQGFTLVSEEVQEGERMHLVLQRLA